MSAEQSNQTVNKYQNSKIYMITNTINDKIYVGSTTTSLKERLRIHKKEAKNENSRMSRLFYKTLKENPEAFSIKLIESYPCISRNELEVKEYQVMNDFLQKIGRDKLYNICLSKSGMGHQCFGKKLSEETKQKMSEANIGKILSDQTKQKLSEINKGKTLKEETKQKISEKLKGKNIEENHPNFKYGCVEERIDRYVFRWFFSENNERKRTSKTFNFKKCGSKELALKACLEFQKQIYPQLNENN